MSANHALASKAADLASPVGEVSPFLNWKRVALVALLTFAVGWPVLTHPLGLDQGIYAVNASRMLAGKALYKEAWDMKPPGIFFMYAIPIALGGFRVWPIELFHLLIHCAAALAILRLALSWFRATGPAWCSVAVYLYYSFGWGFPVTNGQSDDWMLPFFLWGYVNLIEAWRLDWRRGAKRALLAGVLMGWTLVMRTTMLFAVVGLPICWLFAGAGEERSAEEAPLGAWPRFLRLLAAYVAGGLTTGLATLAYFAATDSLDALFYSQLVWVRNYAQTYIHWDNFDFGGLYSLFATEWERNFDGWVLYSWALPFGALGLLSWRLRGRPIPRSALGLWACGFMLGACSIIVQLKFFNYHFWPTFPFCAMASGLAIWSFLDWSAYCWNRAAAGGAASRARWGALSAALLVALPLLLYRDPTGVRECRKRYRQAVEYMAGRADREDHWNRMKFHHIYDPFSDWRVAQAIAARVPEGEKAKVYIWGFKPSVYFDLGVLGPSRFPYNLPLRAPWSPPEWLARLEDEVMADPPDFVVVGRADSFGWVVGHHRTSEDDMPAWLKLELESNFHHVMATKFTHLYARNGVKVLRGGDPIARVGPDDATRAPDGESGDSRP